MQQQMTEEQRKELEEKIKNMSPEELKERRLDFNEFVKVDFRNVQEFL